ncbi:hypothetical protein LUX73_22970 [Actinomadura madurae]|nr:hypothetical protein [Actinomadura madurae]MCQ0007243.1 hypothetical protein [Actinomadura madurae]
MNAGDLPSSFAMPKSMSFGPDASMMMLLGLMSRWTIDRSRRASSVVASRTAIQRTVRTGSAPSRATSSCSVGAFR